MLTHISSPPGNAASPPSPLPAIVCLVADLFFATRFQDVISAQGGQPILVETPEAFVTAIDRAFPVLALVDLAAPGDWRAAIERIKLRPHTKQTPLYAFGSHVDVQTLQAARQAGADHAWARSRLMAELPALVAQHLNPPVRYPLGWDDGLPPEAQAGVAAFNRGEYFEQHEHFEHAWLAETRPIRELYQGILQVGVAFYQIQQGNWAGALKLFRRGLPRLRDLPPICQGLQVGKFYTAAAAIHAEVTALGPERLAAFDRRRFPILESIHQPDQPIEPAGSLQRS